MPSVSHIPVEHTVTVNKPIKVVYDRWNRVEEFPSFMEGVREIAWLDERRFNLLSESGGRFFTSICEIALRIPERRIAWRTLSGPDSSGVVCFQNAGGGRTEVTLKMRYDPATGWEDREQVEGRLRRNLQRFQDLVENSSDSSKSSA
jgi:uncharacterized membrane protein